MEKKDKRDSILKKLYKHVRHRVIPTRGGCPTNDVFCLFVHKELNEEEKEHFEGHLLCCSECKEKLEIIREIEQIENSFIEVPEELYKKARKILYKGNKENSKQEEDK
ncbi:MAG: hypothetical protein ACMUIU_09770 [bacterium]